MNAERRRLAERLFRELREMSFDGVGISRETYGPGETDAMRLIEQVAIEHGLETRWDAARNLIVTLSGQDPEQSVVASGSHLDSVPQGGNFDGAAGVIATFLALLAAKECGPLHRTIELYVLRGEESAWYGGPCYLGSRALFGLLSQDDLASKHRVSGESLADNMAKAGVDLAPITGARPLVDPACFHCWIELHIEQGPVLVAKDKPVGIVTGIRGNIRHRRVVCRGQAAHSGAVPRWLRHDAVLAMAELLMRIDEHWRVLLEWGEDLVVTSGIVETNAQEHAISRVPGEVSFVLEYRSQDARTLRSFEALVRSECAQIEAKRGVTFDLGASVYTEPARMSDRLVKLVESIAAEDGVPCEIMASGGGHDSAVFANVGIPSTMVFVRNDKGSHNPHEAMDYPDFFLGTEVLSRALLKAASMAEDVRQ
jgi:beta-ureidopropionase / N-carbamoyl-L-amino-acid hydrolase